MNYKYYFEIVLSKVQFTAGSGFLLNEARILKVHLKLINTICILFFTLGLC